MPGASIDKPRPVLPNDKVNRLLVGLPRREPERHSLRCDLVRLIDSVLLVSTGAPVRHVYFPIDCTISSTAAAGMCAPLGIGLIGREGMLGRLLLLGHGALQMQATVGFGSRAWRISRTKFIRAANASPALQRRVANYFYLTLDYLIQKAACTHFIRSKRAWQVG